MPDELYAFLMRALLAEESLRGTRAKLRLAPTSSVEDIDRDLSMGLLNPEFLAPARRMAEVYAAIATFERSVRDLVRVVLQESFGEAWWKAGASDKIRSRAATRASEEAKFRWHSSRGEDPLEYTDLGDLSLIISQNWSLFEAHFHSQTWAKNVIDVLEKSRNVIMHSGDLDEQDIVRVGVFLRDWVKQVG